MRAFVAVCGLPAALATCVVWLAFAIGYFGTYAWPFDLFANFRVQYLALFSVCAVALAIARWRKAALFAFLGVVAATMSIAPYFRTAPPLPDGPGGFRLLTFNTWFRNDDLERITSFVEHSRADVVVLQEVDVSRLEALSAATHSYPYRTHTPRVRRGLVILSRTPLTGVEHFEIPGRVTRVTRASIERQGTNITIIGAHLSWPITPVTARQRAEELDLIAERVRRESDPVMVAGDFNLTPWSPYFTRLLERSGLADCSLGLGTLATWPAQFPPARIRIDHCLVSPHWRVRNVAVGPQLGSDHLPLIADLELKRD